MPGKGRRNGRPSALLPAEPSGHRDPLPGLPTGKPEGLSTWTLSLLAPGHRALGRRYNPSAHAQPASPKRQTPARPTRLPEPAGLQPPSAYVARRWTGKVPWARKAAGRSPAPGPASPRVRERQRRRRRGPTWRRPRAGVKHRAGSHLRAGAGGTRLHPPPTPAVKQRRLAPG